MIYGVITLKLSNWQFVRLHVPFFRKTRTAFLDECYHCKIIGDHDTKHKTLKSYKAVFPNTMLYFFNLLGKHVHISLEQNLRIEELPPYSVGEDFTQ